MKAIRYHEPGDPTVLTLETVDRPRPNPEEILVAVRAASINPTDAKRRARGEVVLPKTTGSDFAGVVEEVGSDVSEFAPGNRVCGTGLHTKRFHQGSFAEYVSVPKDIVTHLPSDISFEDGAAVSLVGVTAWRALVNHADLRPDDVCLIHGGTGGVGHIAVQLARSMGSQTVTTVGSLEGERAARELGADVVVRYDSENLQQSVGQITKRGFDVILDHRVDEYLQFDIDVAALNGRIITYGGEGGTLQDARKGRRKSLRIHMMSISNTVTSNSFPTIGSILSHVIGLVDRGLLSPVVAGTYTLEEAQELHRAVLEDSFIGKLVVTL